MPENRSVGKDQDRKAGKLGAGSASGDAPGDKRPSDYDDTIDSSRQSLPSDFVSAASGDGPTQNDSLHKDRGKPLSPDDLPERFGRYEVRGLLGRGAFGAVFLAFDERLERKVAIKVPRFDVDLESIEAEFMTEARQVAKLKHPGIVTVHDVGIDEGRCFIVSDYLEGKTLSKWARRNEPSWQQSVEITIALAQALAHAHSKRVVHRDLKPGNVIMVDGRHPVIVDFGLALSDVKMTGREKGLVAGTPSYMSPEQVRGVGHRIDGRTDIYALGVILYELLTGHLPFQAKNLAELLRQVEEDDPQPPRQLNPDIPKELESVCLKAMAKSIRKRFITAMDLIEALQKCIAIDHHQETLPSTRAIDLRTESVPESLETLVQEADEEPVADEPHDSDTQIRSDLFAGRSTRRSGEALRRRITLVQCACDIFTSEEMIETLGLDEQQELLVEFQQLCRNIAHEFGGTAVQSTTDGLLLCFGYPFALEDSSQRAIRCASKLISAMDEFNRQSKVLDEPLTASAWIHSDQAIVQDKTEQGEGLSIVGQVLNVMDQLEYAAEPDAVIVTSDTQGMVRGFFEWKSLGMQRLKGVGQRELFLVTGERAAGSRIAADASGLTPLIGRDREVGLLVQRWEQASEGMGQVVSLIGDAGIGKSRLVYTLKEHVVGNTSNAGHVTGTIIEWRSSSQRQGSSFYPAIEFLETLCGFESNDSSTARLEKLAEQLAEHNLDGDEEIALLAALLSIPLGDRYPELNLEPQRQKEKQFELLGDMLRELSYRQPLLFVVEDLHWVDPTTLDFLETFVSQGANEAIFTLLTYRPEFSISWQAVASQTQIALNRLTRREIAEMISAKAGDARIPSDVVMQIAERTDGVPLFVEEFTKMAIESRTQQGAVSGSGSFRSHQVPATLQDLLMARLDRIDANIDVVQLAASIGREFSLELISAVSELDAADLNAELDKLVAAEVLFSRGRPPRTRYTFKHALIQDAAYETLLRRKRQEFHRVIGETIESDFSDVVSKQPELLAMHFTEAGLDPKAIEYWDQAGTRSLELRAHKEAIRHLRCGLELLEKQPESEDRLKREIRMRTAIGVPLQATIGYSAPEVEETYARAHQLCTQLGLTTELFPILYGMFRYYMLQAKYEKALELSSKLLAIADQTHTPHFVVAANRAHGGPPVYQGRHLQALPLLEKVVSIEPTVDLRAAVYRYDVVDPWIASRSYLSWACWLLGNPDQSLQHSNAAVQIADELDHSFSSALAISFSQWVHQFRRDVQRTLQTAEKAMAISREHGFAFWYGWCRVMRGWAMAQQGDHSDAIDEIRQGIVDWRAQGSELGSHYYYALLAEACAAAGRFDEGLVALDQAASFAAGTGEAFYVPEISRLRGEFLLRQDPDSVSQAESLFQQSLSEAENQNARALQLRAATSLSRLYNNSGKADDARQILQPIYEWFTEGLDTHDLLQAKELLDSLP